MASKRKRGILGTLMAGDQELYPWGPKINSINPEIYNNPDRGVMEDRRFDNSIMMRLLGGGPDNVLSEDDIKKSLIRAMEIDDDPKASAEQKEWAASVMKLHTKRTGS